MYSRNLVALLLSLAAMSLAQSSKRPMPIDYKETTTYRWLNKPVHESRLLDDMENASTWKFEGAGEMRFTTERAKDGKQSLRIRATTKGTRQGGGSHGRPWEGASAVRPVDGEDWTAFNRLSFWVYPDLPGFNTVSFLVTLRNVGPERGRTGHYLVLRNHEWNHVVWEIPDLARDQVTGVVFTYRRQGHEPGATGAVQFDIDRLELQRVTPDHYEGWNVEPERISFSHTGYQTGSPKRAIASELEAREFQLISQDTGQTVLDKPVQPVQSRIGRFLVLDFSEVNTPGRYILRAGGAETRPFRIAHNVWRDTILKTINFFYAERCGYDVPGIHQVCHQDWQGVHGDKRMIINGGWHDAGDLSQGLVNTAEAVYAMFALAERLRANRQDPELVEKLVEEAAWGLDWVIKVSFGDGHRVTWATMDFWTNGILGDVDDVTSEATNNPFENFLAAAAEAIGARVLKQSDPSRAARSLKMAQADWQFAVDGLKPGAGLEGIENLTEVAGAGILASLDLLGITGDKKYADEAVRLAQFVTSAQQKSFLQGVEPAFTGFFFTSPEKSRLMHYVHRGHEQSPVVALARLCEMFPNHPDYMKWYSSVVLHSEYFQKQMASFTEPYWHLPNGLWKPEEAAELEGEEAAAFRVQVQNGWKVGGDYYLRMYPVQPSNQFRGNFGTALSQVKAISAAAQLRGRLELLDLAQSQLHWVVGRNPFLQSTMFGEGYDYAPQYTAMSGDIVGSLPVGIKMLGNNDLPYWPVTNSWNYKEVWVHPSSRWLWLMEDLAGPAVVTGRVPSGSGGAVTFRNVRTGEEFTARPDYATGEFRAEAPEGRYEVKAGSLTRNFTAVPGRAYEIDLRPDRFLSYDVSSDVDGQGNVMITVQATGQGRHEFVVRADNLMVEQPERMLELRSDAPATITWKATLISKDAPWVVVVVPDGDPGQKQEAFGRS